jgi:glycerol kinase
MATGFWAGWEEIVRNHRVERRFMPEMEETERERLYEQWLRAVERARAWVQ